MAVDMEGAAGADAAERQKGHAAEATKWHHAGHECYAACCYAAAISIAFESKEHVFAFPVSPLWESLACQAAGVNTSCLAWYITAMSAVCCPGLGGTESVKGRSGAGIEGLKVFADVSRLLSEDQEASLVSSTLTRE